LLVLATFFFINGLGQVHLFDWDEINFAESSREMLLTGDYFTVQINFQQFWEKPPLFFWLQCASMSVFGVNEFAARFPNAVIGLFTLMVLFILGKKLHTAKFGFVWALIYTASFLPHLYFKSGIIDPVFNLFIFAGIVFGILAINKATDRRNKETVLCGLFVGLAVLTKGPVGLLIPIL